MRRGCHSLGHGVGVVADVEAVVGGDHVEHAHTTVTARVAGERHAVLRVEGARGRARSRPSGSFDSDGMLALSANAGGHR